MMALLILSFNIPLLSIPVYAQPEFEAKMDMIEKQTLENPDKALLVVASNVSWSVVVFDSGLDSTTHSGTGPRDVWFECNTSSPSATYSLVAQKQTEGGGLALFLFQNGEVLDGGMTIAPYGTVSMAGDCGVSTVSLPQG